MKITKVTQSLSQIGRYKSGTQYHIRSSEHLYKSNNWLKKHHRSMRRKPFKREYLVLDEFHLMYEHSENNEFIKEFYNKFTK